MNDPTLTRRIECEIIRKQFFVRVVDTTEDRAILTYIFADDTWEKTERDANRMGKEVWAELGNKTGEWWPGGYIIGIISEIKTCMGIEEI